MTTFGSAYTPFSAGIPSIPNMPNAASDGGGSAYINWGALVPTSAGAAGGATTGATSGIDPSLLNGFSYNSGGGGGGGTASSAALYDPAIQQVNSLLGRLPTQYNVGNQNISNAYNDAYNQLQSSQQQAQRDYTTTKDQTNQDNALAKGNIDFGVGQQTNALFRLLGAHGAGSSSADQAAAYAAARQGSDQRNQVQNTFGRNQQALDTNWGDYTNNFNNSVGDLGVQKQNQLNSLQSTIDQNKSSLLQQLASLTQQKSLAGGQSAGAAQAAVAPFQSQINQLGDQIDQLGLNPSFSANAPAYKAPSLDSYNYSQNSAPTIGNSSKPGFADSISPYLSLLLNPDQKKQSLNGLGA